MKVLQTPIPHPTTIYENKKISGNEKGKERKEKS